MVDGAALIHPTPYTPTKFVGCADTRRRIALDLMRLPAHPTVIPRKGQKRKDQSSKIPGDTKADVVERAIGFEPETDSRLQV